MMESDVLCSKSIDQISFYTNNDDGTNAYLENQPDFHCSAMRPIDWLAAHELTATINL